MTRSLQAFGDRGGRAFKEERRDAGGTWIAGRHNDYVLVSPLFFFSLTIDTAGIYAGTLALCVVAWMYDKKKKEHRAATAGLLKEEEHVSLNIQRPGSYGATTR
jgi:cbb3-type cytochrome oxidase subunit 3